MASWPSLPLDRGLEVVGKAVEQAYEFSSTQRWNDCPSREDGKSEIAWPMDRAFGCARNGRRYRMLNVLNEFTHECLAIRVARKLKEIDVIDILSDLFILHGHFHSHPLRQRTGVRGQGRAGMDLSCRCQDRLHRAGQSSGERLHRELQTRVLAMSCSTVRASTLYARPRSSSRPGDATTTQPGAHGVSACIRRVAGCATPTGGRCAHRRCAAGQSSVSRRHRLRLFERQSSHVNS